MSCEACENFQNSDKTYYFRWGNGNVEIRACEEHTKEIMDVLRAAQRQKPGSTR